MSKIFTQTTPRRLALFAGRLARARRILRELNATSDRGLAELGLARGDVAAVAWGRFARA